MTALTAEGVDYSKLISAKLYEHRGMSADKDVEKVYFDGKAVYAPGLTTAIVFIDGSPVTLKGDAPAAEEEEETVAAAAPAASSSDEEECDEYDPDCEDEDEEDYTSYKTSAPVDNTSADDRDYAASDAANDVGDRFGIADEVRFWTAVALSAVAGAGIVMGILNHSKAGEAQDAYDELSEINDKVLSACNTDANPDKCRAVMSEKAGNSDWTLANMQKRMDENKKTHDSYATARNIWFGVAAGAIAGAVVLFVW